MCFFLASSPASVMYFILNALFARNDGDKVINTTSHHGPGFWLGARECKWKFHAELMCSMCGAHRATGAHAFMKSFNLCSMPCAVDKSQVAAFIVTIPATRGLRLDGPNSTPPARVRCNHGIYIVIMMRWKICRGAHDRLRNSHVSMSGLIVRRLRVGTPHSVCD